MEDINIYEHKSNGKGKNKVRAESETLFFLVSSTDLDSHKDQQGSDKSGVFPFMNGLADSNCNSFRSGGEVASMLVKSERDFCFPRERILAIRTVLWCQFPITFYLRADFRHQGSPQMKFIQFSPWMSLGLIPPPGQFSGTIFTT